MSIRRATHDDLAAIRQLEKVAFPKNNLDLEPAAPGELEEGIERRQFWVFETGSKIIGFIQFEKLSRSQYNLIAIVVDPKHQGQHVGKKLVKKVLKRVQKKNPDAEIACVTSPRNTRMMSMLLDFGFKGVEHVSNYFGPGKDRLWFKYTKFEPDYPSTTRVSVPLEEPATFIQLMSEKSFHLIGVKHSAQGLLVTLGQPIIADPVSLRQTEANTSVAQASGILAALAFILGFVYKGGTKGINSALGVFLILSIVLTAGAVQLYANSTGNMARIGDGNFDKHMKWGNLLLDFGGHYPLVLILPALVASDLKDNNLAMIAGVGVSLLLFWYEFSPFSIFKRYKFTWFSAILVGITCLVPFVSVIFIDLKQNSSAELWMAFVFVLLAARFALQSRKTENERRQVSSKKRG